MNRVITATPTGGIMNGVETIDQAPTLAMLRVVTKVFEPRPLACCTRLVIRASAMAISMGGSVAAVILRIIVTHFTNVTPRAFSLSG